jgi:hypothetical protein
MSDLKYMPLEMTDAERQFMHDCGGTMDLINKAFGIPESKIMKYERATVKNASYRDSELYKDIIDDLRNDLVKALNKQMQARMKRHPRKLKKALKKSGRYVSFASMRNLKIVMK